MKFDNIIPSTLKIIASENINIQRDLESEDSNQPIEHLLNEQKEEKKDQKSPDR